MYDLADLIAWAKAGAAAYADSRAQGLACVNHYRGLQGADTKGVSP